MSQMGDEGHFNNYYCIIVCSHTYFHWLSSFCTLLFHIVLSNFIENFHLIQCSTNGCICVIWHGTMVNLIKLFILFRFMYSISHRDGRRRMRKNIKEKERQKWRSFSRWECYSTTKIEFFLYSVQLTEFVYK